MIENQSETLEQTKEIGKAIIRDIAELQASRGRGEENPKSVMKPATRREIAGWGAMGRYSYEIENSKSEIVGAHGTAYVMNRHTRAGRETRIDFLSPDGAGRSRKRLVIAENGLVSMADYEPTNQQWGAQEMVVPVDVIEDPEVLLEIQHDVDSIVNS